MRVFPPFVLASFVTILAGLGLETVILPAWSAAQAPPIAPAAGKPRVSVEFIGNGAIELKPGKSATAATVLIRNDSPVAAKATFHLTLVDHAGNTLAAAEQIANLDPLRATTVTLSVPVGFPAAFDSRLPARGIVMMSAVANAAAGNIDAATADTASPVQPALVSRDLIVLQVQPSMFGSRITIVALGAALLVLVIGSGLSLGAKDNVAVAGSPTWTPQSWSTNLAIGGALLTTFVGIGALPAQTHFVAKLGYSVLSTFYAALVASAPTIYGLLKAGGKPTPRGALFLFSVAASMTVWATIGQLGTTGLLFLELKEARLLDAYAAQAAVSVAALMALLVVVHAIRAIWFYFSAPANPTQGPGGGPVNPPGVGGTSGWPLL